MSSAALVKDALVAAPVAAADATGLTGVARYASATSSTSVAIPEGMYGNFVRIASIGCDTDVAVSKGAAQTLVANQTADLGTGNAAAGWTIPSGSYIDVIIPKRASTGVTHYLNFISSATGGYVVIYMSEVLGGV